MKFMEAQLPSESFRQLLANARPVRYLPGASQVKFSDAFKDCKIWFNHFVKVSDLKVLTQEQVCRLMSRGAAIICAKNQPAVDILVPYCKGNILRPCFVSCILYQIKNIDVQPFSALLLDNMDPVKLGFFGPKSAKLPVIRIVFNLHSQDAKVTIPQPPQVKHHPDQFTAYDVWFQGCSKSSFGVVQEQDHDSIQAILSRSWRDRDIYSLADEHLFGPSGTLPEEIQNTRRQMHPGVQALPPHFSNWYPLE
jgi:hypothetical protein